MRDVYDYPIPGDDTGEAWVISANSHGASTVLGGTYDGQSLAAYGKITGNYSEAWRGRSFLFW